MRMLPRLATVLLLVALSWPGGPEPAAAQETTGLRVWLEPAAGAGAEVTWSDLREEGLHFVVEGAEPSPDDPLFTEEGLILMAVLVEDGAPAGAWRSSSRVSSVQTDRTSLDPDQVPEAEVGTGTLRFMTGEASVGAPLMMDESPEGMRFVLEGAAAVGGDPSGTFVAIFPLPMEPDIAGRTEIRLLYGFVR
jgi:hypothetical protein